MTKLTIDSENGSKLFSPFKVRDVVFPNRIVVSPMQTYQASPGGTFTDWHFQHLARFAIGGAGCVITEALMIAPDGRGTIADCGIWSDDNIEPMKRLVTFLHENGSIAGCQIHHAGPRAATPRPWDMHGDDASVWSEADWQPLGPSDGTGAASKRLSTAEQNQATRRRKSRPLMTHA